MLFPSRRSPHTADSHTRLLPPRGLLTFFRTAQDLPSDDDGDMEVGGSSSGGGGRGLGQLSGSQLSSAICLLRGRAYHALDNRSSSVRWFSEALRRDLYNSEAFDELIEKRLLTHEEEMELLTSVLGGQGGSSARPEDEWLKVQRLPPPPPPRLCLPSTNPFLHTQDDLLRKARPLHRPPRPGGRRWLYGGRVSSSTASVCNRA